MAVRLYPHGAWILLSGLACFLIFLGLLTESFVAIWLQPLPGSPLVCLICYGPYDLLAGVVVGGGLSLLWLLSLVLILFGLHSMRMTYPLVGARTSWRIGPVLLEPAGIAGFLVVAVALSFFASLAMVEARGPEGYTGEPSFIGRSVLLALGTFLMIVPGEALRPLVPPPGDRPILAAETAALFGGLLLTGSDVAAFLLGHGGSPLFRPWASVPSGVSGIFALVMLMHAAWRVASRWEPDLWMAPG